MNPSLKVLLALIVSLELSFKVSLYTNLLVMTLCLCWLLVKKMRPKAILTMLFFATLAAFTVFSSAYLFSDRKQLWYALDITTRVYVYTLTTACLTVSTTAEEMARSLEQNLQLFVNFLVPCSLLNLLAYLML